MKVSVIIHRRIYQLLKEDLMLSQFLLLPHQPHRPDN